jgi:hypothetical protein
LEIELTGGGHSETHNERRQQTPHLIINIEPEKVQSSRVFTSQHKNRNTYCAEESSPQLNRKKAKNRLLRENQKLIKAKMTKAAAK